jgi:hypothetical protein
VSVRQAFYAAVVGAIGFDGLNQFWDGFFGLSAQTEVNVRGFKGDFGPIVGVGATHNDLATRIVFFYDFGDPDYRAKFHRHCGNANQVGFKVLNDVGDFFPDPVLPVFQAIQIKAKTFVFFTEIEVVSPFEDVDVKDGDFMTFVPKGRSYAGQSYREIETDIAGEYLIWGVNQQYAHFRRGSPQQGHK